MMVYLVGVYHLIQHDGPIKIISTDTEYVSECQNKAIVARSKFLDYLKTQISRLQLGLIAEEFSIEAIKVNSAIDSIIHRLAEETKLPHCFCDPDTMERNAHNILNGDKDKRENFWLDRLSKYKTNCTLFICGDDHVETFSEKLRNKGYDVEVLSKSHGKDTHDFCFPEVAS